MKYKTDNLNKCPKCKPGWTTHTVIPCNDHTNTVEDSTKVDKDSTVVLDVNQEAVSPKIEEIAQLCIGCNTVVPWLVKGAGHPDSELRCIGCYGNDSVKASERIDGNGPYTGEVFGCTKCNSKGHEVVYKPTAESSDLLCVDCYNAYCKEHGTEEFFGSYNFLDVLFE